MHRFFIPPEWIEKDKVIFKGDTSRQMRQVLRIRAGEKVEVLDNLGNEYQVEINPFDDTLTGKILSKQKSTREPAIHLTLLFALAQREKVEWILQKATEIGVSRFVPLVTTRSLVQDSVTVESKMERWKLILKEAAEQSGRGLIPELVSARNFSEGLEMIQKLDLGLFAWEQEEKEGLQDILHRKELRRIGVIIGPEGGFTDEEYHQAVSAGWKSISLGRRILRMETAALVASALIISTFEKLG